MGFLRKLFSPVPAAPPKEITKKDIKSLFRAIRGGELKAVKELIAANQDFVKVCAAAPPKKDDGQSPLHVALKTGRFAIADYLIDKGADVNFMEESKINEWRTPVLHDAIRAALFSSQLGDFGSAIRTMKKMLERGSDANALDSYGNTCLMRAIQDANQRMQAAEADVRAKLLAEIGEVFAALIKAGADVHVQRPQRGSAVEETRGTVLEQFIA
ncbi:MAG: hypothetical protein QOF78_1190 [Phycisphaerales bacterium]|jgi:ankyrin repeat protein|nr:hypothetical protein [Phycisphaerales bacterium]